MIHIRENNLRRILAAGLLLAVGQTVSAMPFSARDNFKDGLAWYEKSGVWTVQEGVYRQTDQKANPAMSYFGDRGWKDYSFKTKARRLSKTGGLLFCAAVSADDTYVYFLVREHNSELGVRTMGTVQVQVGEPVGIADNAWHEVEIKVGIGKGQEWDRLQSRFQCFLDGKLVFDKQWRLNEFTKRGIFIVDEVHVRGAVALGTEAASAEFKDVRVDGTIMEDAPWNAGLFGQTRGHCELCGAVHSVRSRPGRKSADLGAQPREGTDAGAGEALCAPGTTGGTPRRRNAGGHSTGRNQGNRGAGSDRRAPVGPGGAGGTRAGWQGH